MTPRGPDNEIASTIKSPPATSYALNLSPPSASALATARTENSASALCRALNRFQYARRERDVAKRSFPPLPPPSKDRLDASLNEKPIDLDALTKLGLRDAEEKGKTILYLAYGSNLSSETFRGKRGIRPLSQINVQVPELKLTFDLPGIPYTEPCFANSGLRDPEDEGACVEALKRNVSFSSTGMEDVEKGALDALGGRKYHKDRWHKGLIGCVYEVTPSDYAHIIATEGGGASYKDITVTCYPLPKAETVPARPETAPFKAHTLFAPAARPDSDKCGSAGSRLLRTTGRFTRPDPSYAQPSARYLKLITDGAAEISLPMEYQTFLAQIRPYTITSTRQKMGQNLIVTTFMPFFFMIMALQHKFQDDKGRSPKWLANLMGMLFLGLWSGYDTVLKKAFGDGERTIGQNDDNDEETGKGGWMRRKQCGTCAV